MSQLLERLRQTRPDGSGRTGRVKVLVALRSNDGSVRGRLEKLGLAVETTLSDKLIGHIEGSALEHLRADPDVTEVEASVPLKPLAR